MHHFGGFAFGQFQADDLAWFKVLTQALPLGDPKAVAEFISVVKAAFDGEEIELVVLDTQARCTEGLDENAARDMGLAIGQMDRIKRALETEWGRLFQEYGDT